MRAITKLSLLVALATTGCNSETGLTALDELMVTSLSGAEDSANAEAGRAEAETGGGATGGGQTAGEGQDRSDPPPMFRDCDAQRTFEGYVEAYDEDASGEIDSAEGQEIVREHGGPAGGPRDHFRHMLNLVYDLDADATLSESERAVAFEDFTARCEAIHAEVVATHDTDGDGQLSPEEEEEARAAQAALVAAEREETAACEQTCSRGGGEASAARRGEGEGEGPGGPGGEGGGAPAEGSGAAPDDGGPWGPLEMEFDADESGALDADELATLREVMRERIRSGARPQQVCVD